MTGVGTFIHRDLCRRHFIGRACERGIELTPAEARRLERRLGRARPAFLRPGVDRYRLRLKWKNRRIVVVYDSRLGCLVTLWAFETGVNT